jgi:hypothetical protein
MTEQPMTGRVRLRGAGARREQTALAAAAACTDETGSAWAGIRGGRLRRLVGLLRLIPQTRGNYSCYDARFERPELIEDDYYRLRNQPRGW